MGAFDFRGRNLRVARKTAAYTVSPDDAQVYVDATSGAVAITLLNQNDRGPHTVLIQKTDASANVVTVTAPSGKTINGASTYPLSTQYAGALFTMDESGNWLGVGGAIGNLTSGVTGDVTFSAAGVSTIGAAKVTRAQMSAPAGRQAVQRVGGTIATTGATVEYMVVQEAGSLQSAEVTPLVALTANDTNYITWTIVNLGQTGGGSTAMLAVSDLNTTKATGGLGLAINTKRVLTIHGTGANLVVAAGDLLSITATATGTLANTVTRPLYQLRFSGTT